ncbi:hypothetical protein C5167_043226 [Papaver somniferum]|uniref:Uncharacterized protein n=1 Tax=Papaver somniferum TaxID=3469 RepID=A0A4Y7L637_PAPSO|nr:hypothetical protein C5167_043226 [Papaver somniferum]
MSKQPLLSGGESSGLNKRHPLPFGRRFDAIKYGDTYQKAAALVDLGLTSMFRHLVGNVGHIPQRYGNLGGILCFSFSMSYWEFTLSQT